MVIQKFPDIRRVFKNDLKDMLERYKSGEIDIRNYWKVGDVLEYDSQKYVIIGIGHDKVYDTKEREKRTVTIMRTDLINFETSLKSIKGDYSTKEFDESELRKQLEFYPDYFVGELFSDLALIVKPKIDMDKTCRTFLLSSYEIFEEKYRYEYFIDKKNRQLGNEFWTRSNLHMPHFVYFETCKSDGTEGKAFNTDVKGIVPCFVI